MSVNPKEIRIAVVDDDPVILNVFSLMIKRFGYVADFFLISEEAFKIISEHPKHYNLLISDIFMPNEDGISFAKRVRSVAPDLPIIFMTGNESQEIRNQALSLGRVTFFGKPFPLLEVLKETIDKFLTQTGS